MSNEIIVYVMVLAMVMACAWRGGGFEPGITTLEHLVRINVDCCVVVRVT